MLLRIQARKVTSSDTAPHSETTAPIMHAPAGPPRLGGPSVSSFMILAWARHEDHEAVAPGDRDHLAH